MRSLELPDHDYNILGFLPIIACADHNMLECFELDRFDIIEVGEFGDYCLPTSLFSWRVHWMSFRADKGVSPFCFSTLVVFPALKPTTTLNPAHVPPFKSAQGIT